MATHLLFGAPAGAVGSREGRRAGARAELSAHRFRFALPGTWLAWPRRDTVGPRNCAVTPDLLQADSIRVPIPHGNYRQDIGQQHLP